MPPLSLSSQRCIGQRVDARIALVLAEEVEIREIFDVDDATKAAGKIVLGMLIVVPPVRGGAGRIRCAAVQLRMRIADDGCVQVAGLHVLGRSRCTPCSRD